MIEMAMQDVDIASLSRRNASVLQRPHMPIYFAYPSAFLMRVLEYRHGQGRRQVRTPISLRRDRHPPWLWTLFLVFFMVFPNDPAATALSCSPFPVCSPQLFRLDFVRSFDMLLRNISAAIWVVFILCL